MAKPSKRDLYGITTVGEKGQVVIPAEARRSMGLKKGDKLVVFGKADTMLGFIKLSSMESFVNHLAENLAEVRKLTGIKE